MTLRRWRWVAGALVLLLAAVAVRVSVKRRDAPNVLPAHEASASGGVTSGTSLLEPLGLDASAVARASLTAAGGGNLEREALKARMKADWCGFGAREASKQSDDVLETAQTASAVEGQETVAALKRTVGAEVLEEAMQQVRLRWAAQLMRRGDLRSQSVADTLLASLDDAGSQARARLQARAATSSDPLLTVLALRYPCPAGACRNIETSQWSRLEPANMDAWLKLLEKSGASGPSPSVDYVLDRLATQARYSRGYREEIGGMLLSLSQATSPGLQGEAEQGVIYASVWLGAMPMFVSVAGACRAPHRNAQLVQRCEAVAQLMWQQGDQMQRMMAMSIARALVQQLPELRRQWEPRAREAEAVQQWVSTSGYFTLKRWFPDGEENVPPCDLQAPFRELLRETVTTTEWDRMQSAMREAGADESALSAAYHQVSKRGLLDPLPSPAR